MALSSSLVALGIIIGIYGLLAIGLNVKFGFAGLLDIGHVLFFLIGAYGVALLVAPAPRGGIEQTYILGLNLPWVIAGGIAVIAAGIAGMVVALPAIRLREDYLAITVLGFSVIARRIIQNEAWLANGPRSLRGYSTPLADYFPLPAGGNEPIVLFSGLDKVVPVALEVSGPIDEVIFGAIVLVLWAVGAYVIGMVLDDNSPEGIRGWIVHGLLAVLSLGIGYVAGRRAIKDRTSPAAGPPLLGGLLAGLAATVGMIAVDGQLILQAFLGPFSLLTWVLAVLLITDRYDHVSRRDGLAGFGIGMAFFASLLPLIVLGGQTGDIVSSAGLLLTLAALSAFLYGTFYLGSNWDRLGGGAEFVSVIGFSVLWLFGLRYFILALVAPFKQGGALSALDQLIQNLLWLVRYTATGAQFGYTRFVFALTLGLLALTYLVAETTVTSPFGRVLKAIREDENVATALGKNSFVYKTQAMILGSAIAGLAGVMLALHRGTLTYLMFRPRVTFWVFLMVIIGGVANNRGVLLGAVIFWAFRQVTVDIRGYFPTEASARLSALRIAFIGALLIIILYYRPEGIWGEKGSVLEEGEVES